jgi:hypothetical protein
MRMRLANGLAGDRKRINCNNTLPFGVDKHWIEIELLNPGLSRRQLADLHDQIRQRLDVSGLLAPRTSQDRGGL